MVNIDEYENFTFETKSLRNSILACAFDGSTPDLQIEHQLKRIQSDIHINMDKLVS